MAIDHGIPSVGIMDWFTRVDGASASASAVAADAAGGLILPTADQLVGYKNAATVTGTRPKI